LITLHVFVSSVITAHYIYAEEQESRLRYTIALEFRSL